MENNKWVQKKKSGPSSKELQKYGRGAIADHAEDSGDDTHISFDKTESIESRMRSEMSNRGFSERNNSKHGSTSTDDGSTHPGSTHRGSTHVESSRHGSTEDALEAGD